jgi:hypothetical protein
MKTKNGLCLLLFTLASCGGGGAGSKSSSIPNIDPSTVPQSAPRSETRAEETPTLEVRVKRKTPFLNDFSNFDAFVEDINSYSVSFLAKAGHYYGAEVTCYKKNYDPIPTKSVQKFDSSGLKAQMILSMNETDSQTVLFTCHVVNGSDEFDKVTIELKKSLVVKGRQDIVAFGLSGVTKVETLVLDTDSVLSTEGNNFHLRVKEIISRKGKIVTFPEDYKHEPNNNEKGKSSGLINITAERVWGLISFELRGLDAGSQTKVPSQQPRRGIPVGYNNNKSQCQAARGTEGYQGQTGFSGYDGGDTGFVQMSVVEDSLFQVSFKYFPGHGGKGGAGGAGGEGAAGGRAYVVQVGGPSIFCREGERGPTGSVGHEGPAGNLGNINESSLTIGNNPEVLIKQNWSNFENYQ